MESDSQVPSSASRPDIFGKFGDDHYNEKDCDMDDHDVEEYDDGFETDYGAESSSNESDAEYQEPKYLGRKRNASATKALQRPPKVPKYKDTDITSLLTKSNSIPSGGDPSNTAHVPTIQSGTTGFNQALKQVFESARGGEKVQDVTKADFIRAYRQYPGRCIRPTTNDQGEIQWTTKGMKFGLYNHQFLGVAKMLKKEVEIGGGLLSDVMGVGKTRMLLVLLLVSRLIKDPETKPREMRKRKTLIVVPSALVRQWYDEAEDHFAEKKLGRIVKYGAGNPMSVKELEKEIEKHEIIITTYDAVQKARPEEARPNKFESIDAEIAWELNFEAAAGVLLRHKFYRVVLDEAQAIKNHNSLTSIACREIKAEKRWAISGTPLQNNIDELFPYFSFLKISGAETIRDFKKNFPLTKGKDVTESRRYQKLQEITIRRTHGTTILHRPIVALTERQERTIEVTLSKAERACYDAIDCWAKVTTANILERERRKKHTQDTVTLILVITQRLREMTSHFMLTTQLLTSVPNLDLKSLISEATSDTSSSFEQEKVQKMLGILEKMFKKYSKSPHGLGFLKRYIDRSAQPKVPSKMKDPTSKDKYEQKQAPKFQLNKWLEQDGQILYSAKLRAALKQIEQWRQTGPQDKIIVFSQFAEVIKMIGLACKERGWGHKLYHGKMKAHAKNNSLEAFKNDDSVVVLVASLKCGGVGLNLTHASRVIIFDLWWNTAVEEQAAARVHRLGQNKAVEIIRLLAHGTIDEKIRKMQVDKDQKIKELMTGTGKAKNGTKVNDLIELLGVDMPKRTSCKNDSDVDEELPLYDSEDGLSYAEKESDSDSDTDSSSDSNSDGSGDDFEDHFEVKDYDTYSD